MQESFEHLIIVSFYFAPSFLRERPFQAAKSAVAASAVADGPGMGPALTPSPVKRRLSYTSVRVASKKDGRSRSEEGPEEEAHTTDEIEPVEVHSPGLFYLETDEETVLSPKKVVPPNLEIHEPREVPPPDPLAAREEAPEELKVADAAAPMVEDMLNSEDEGAGGEQETKAKKTTFKDLGGCFFFQSLQF